MVLTAGIPLLQLSILMFSTAGPDPEVVGSLMDDGVTVHVYINGIACEFKLSSESMWPGLMIVDDVGSIDFQFNRLAAKTWSPWSMMRPLRPLEIRDSVKRKNILNSPFFEAYVKGIVQLRSNIRRVTIAYKNKIFAYPGVARFMNLKMPNGVNMKFLKAFNVPVLPVKSLTDPNHPINTSAAMEMPHHFIVEEFGVNNDSAWLYNARMNDAVLMSKPQYSTFDPIILRSAALAKLYLIANGFGLVPLLSVLFHALHKSNSVEIKLFIFNKEEKYIFWRKEINDLVMKANGRLRVEFYLKYGCEKCSLSKVKMSHKFLAENFLRYNASDVKGGSHFVLAGSRKFLKYTLESMEEVLGYPDEYLSFIKV